MHPQVAGRLQESVDEAAVIARPGLRYMTIFATDLNLVLKRLAESGFEPPKLSPVRLGDEATQQVQVVILSDPDGNIVELVVPHKNE